jgi:predicted transcriptional regulator
MLKNKIIKLSASIMLFFFSFSCQTTMEDIDKISEACKEEQVGQKPDVKHMRNYTSQERRRKRKEIQAFNQRRVSLYKLIHSYNTIYKEISERKLKSDTAKIKELESLRNEIMTICPVAGSRLPIVKEHK